MAGTYISLDHAKAVVAKINLLDPPITAAEPAKVAVAVTSSAIPDLTQDADYYAVWKDCGFSQNCKNAGDAMTGYAGSWDDMMRNEYNAWMANHEPASQYGDRKGREKGSHPPLSLTMIEAPYEMSNEEEGGS